MPEFITKADIVTVCGLNSLVEDRKVAPWITEAHLRWRKILGGALHDLQQAAPAEPRFINLMADGKGFGKSYLCWTAFALAYPSLAAEADRGGVFVKEEAGKFQSADPRTLAMLKNTAEAAAETREQLLFQYLMDNSAIYPELNTVTGSEDRINSQTARNIGGVSFRRGRAQGAYRG